MVDMNIAIETNMLRDDDDDVCEERTKEIARRRVGKGKFSHKKGDWIDEERTQIHGIYKFPFCPQLFFVLDFIRRISYHQS